MSEHDPEHDPEHNPEHNPECEREIADARAMQRAPRMPADMGVIFWEGRVVVYQWRQGASAPEARGLGEPQPLPMSEELLACILADRNGHQS